MIPKLSAPLIKDIRTGEGILEYVLGVVAVIAGATGDLSVSRTGVYLTILAVAKGARRGLIKLVALQKGVGIGAPISPVLTGSSSAGSWTVGPLTSSPSVEGVLAQIDAAEQAAAAKQAEPGTPAPTIGLAPEPEPTPTKPAK